ncbi:plasma membrane ATPase 1 [Phakopsora pachyrhizi]|nr:plasma membrane ATPase 1 [Phakopsora pachyrhizi]
MAGTEGVTKAARNFDKTFEEEKGATKCLVDINTIQLNAEDLYDREKVDLEQVQLEDVWTLLQTNETGLTESEVQRRREIFGANKLEEKKVNPFLQFLSFMWNPLSWVMEGAALVSIALSNGENRPPDWQDFVGINVSLNSGIGYYEERSAGNAVKALMDSLAPKAKVRRAGQWAELESSELVPGDIVSFKIGDVVPSDCRLFDAVNVSIDQAALTGESLPCSKSVGDQCFSGSICKQGEAEGIVIATGANTFFGRAATLCGAENDSTGHMQAVLSKVCGFVTFKLIVLYGVFHYSYRRGLDNLLVLLIGGIPIAMPTVLSVTLAVGAQQLAKYKAIVTRITAIEELAGVTILCSDKTGTLTTNKLTIDKSTVKTYSDVSADDVCLLASYASRTENQDAIDSCIVGDGIKLVEFKPFDPVIKRTEITYNRHCYWRDATSAPTTRPKPLSSSWKDDVEEFARRGLRALAVAYEDVPSGDTKQTIDDAIALGIKVKMVTGDQLAIAKETGRRLGLGDMFASRVLKEGPPPGSRFKWIAGVYPEHKYEIVKILQGQANDAPALSRANVGIAVEGATDAARGAGDIVLTEPGLSTIIHAIRQSRIVFQRMRNYSIYACAVTIRIVVGFSILAFAFQFDFPPFMVLVIAILNDGTVMTISLDRVLPSNEPDHWDLAEIFTYAVAYGLHLAFSTIALFYLIVKTTFLEDTFGLQPLKDVNDPQLHMVIYLQVAIISQALIFVTRSHSWFFMEQCCSSLAAFGTLEFSAVQAIPFSWVGVCWLWNLIWFFPLDFIKFSTRACLKKWRKSDSAEKTPVVPEKLQQRPNHYTTTDSALSNRPKALRTRDDRSLGKSGQTRPTCEGILLFNFM